MTVNVFHGLKYFIASKRNLSLPREEQALYEQVCLFFFALIFTVYLDHICQISLVVTHSYSLSRYLTVGALFRPTSWKMPIFCVQHLLRYGSNLLLRPETFRYYVYVQ